MEYKEDLDLIYSALEKAKRFNSIENYERLANNLGTIIAICENTIQTIEDKRSNDRE